MRFIGNIEAKTDSKGRIFFPACFRRMLQKDKVEKLMLRKDVFQDCLVLYTERSWNEQLDILKNKLDKWNAKHQMLFRQFVADVEELSLDKNGRILIPKRYLRIANIEQEVRFIGMDDTIEIWAKERIEKPFIDTAEFGEMLQNIMSEKNDNESDGK